MSTKNKGDPLEIFSPQAIRDLVTWYRKNKRPLPWRDTEDPYDVWLSEIMLQQTRIEAAKGYFARFKKRVKTVTDLAEVSEEELLKLWEGLGYYNRARNLKKAAERLVQSHEGTLPHMEKELLELPGIGPYTAAAIASLAFGEKAACVDGNVLRVVARTICLNEDVGKQSLRKAVKNRLEQEMEEAQKGMGGNFYGDFNQGLMELGEVVCLPGGVPLCGECPLKEGCQARKEGTQLAYPRRGEKKPRKVVKRSIFLVRYQEKVGIAKRGDTGLLAGMYEFPGEDRWMKREEVREQWGGDVEEIGGATHVFSHVEWNMKGFAVTVREPVGELEYVDVTELEAYPIPTAFMFYKKWLASRLMSGKPAGKEKR